MTATPLTALALNCTLKRGDAPSSTDKILREVMAGLAQHGIGGEVLRMANFAIHPGVTADEGNGDEWPGIRRRILAADILVLGTPIWLGQPSSLVKRVLERMDAFISETDDRHRMPTFGKVAIAAVVGNEDGAHHCHAELFQALNDVGFTVAAGAGTYWVGEAMQSKDYQDLDATPEKTLLTSRLAAANAAHLAGLLKAQPYPGLTDDQQAA